MKSRRRSGLSLVIAGLLGMAFFWLTDPRYGPFGHWRQSDEIIDLANQLAPGTVIGLAGSLVVLVIGLWLMTRRTV